MDFKSALKIAADRKGWTPVKVASEVGVSEGQVRRWLQGVAEPRFPQYRALRERLPEIQELIDRMVESEVA